MGIVNCGLGRLDPDIWPGWNMSKKDSLERIGPGEVGRAVPWDTLTAEQKQFQPIKMAIHAAMIHRVDAEIGRVVAHLKAIGVFENTAIFFVSDNGASAEQMIRGDGHDKTAPPGSAKTFLCLGPPWASAANTPLRLHKSYVHEGGISTPLIVHWPRGISARGELRRDPGHLIDLAPTVLELAGGPWPATYDGKAGAAPARQEPRAGAGQGRLGDARLFVVVSRHEPGHPRRRLETGGRGQVALGTVRPPQRPLRSARPRGGASREGQATRAGMECPHRRIPRPGQRRFARPRQGQGEEIGQAG